MEIKVTNRVQDETYETVAYEAILEGATIGYATVIVDSEYTYLERIDIEEEFRGQGYGTAFIRTLADEYGSIVAAPDNEGSQRLFDRLGYDVSDKYWMVDQGYGVYEI
jgi:ribosomal protein S18 acetylase RimI-like enzyme